MLRIFRNPLIAICLIGFGLFMLYAGHKNSVKFAALRDHGKVAEAEITKLEWREKSNHIDGTYTAQIRFTTEDGRDVSAEVGVPLDQGRAVRSKSAAPSMTVRYLPESPNTLQDVNEDDSSEAQSGVGRIMLIAGLVLLALRFFISK